MGKREKGLYDGWEGLVKDDGVLRKKEGVSLVDVGNEGREGIE
ncbi:hypothetical protein [Staphylococcus epidermidis]|nr:hypothetical protein [Staphylococcus epidermidis]